MWQTEFRSLRVVSTTGLLCMGWFAGCSSPTSTVVKLKDAGALSDGASGPRPSVLPGGYKPRIRCGDLGKSCNRDEACGDELACSGGTCMPSVPEQTVACSTPCPASAPICVFGACLSTDQLACLCLEPESREVTPQCASISDKPGQCTSENGLCDTAPDACCEGLSCLRGENDKGEQLLGLCKTPCNADTDCDTSCCAEVKSIAGKFCAPLGLCITECRELSEECDTGRRACCDGLVCTKSDADPTLNGCQKPCSKNSECDTSCCVLFNRPDGGVADNGICAPKDRCPE